MDDNEIADIGARDERIVLTRDIGLLKHKKIKYGGEPVEIRIWYVPPGNFSDDSSEQVESAAANVGESND